MISWRQKKERIIRLVGVISTFFGKDDAGWLHDYCVELIQTNKQNLDLVLDGLSDIANRCRIPLPQLRSKIILHCDCGMTGAFCRCRTDV